MTDVFSPEKRSAVMRRVKGKDTSPELKVRRLLRRMGVGYRLHRADLPGKPDIVDVFRRPDQLPAVAQEAVDAGAGTFWMQLGLHSDEAVEIAHSAGLDVVSNRCVKIEHARFHGGLHLAGFDTGVISSKRTRG